MDVGVIYDPSRQRFDHHQSTFQETFSGGYIQAVPVQRGSFVCRKFLNKNWFGLRDEELEKVSGIPGSIFCHDTGFIGGDKTKEDALTMAIRSLNGD